MSDDMPVKCADCGFLALRVMASRALVDAELETRKDGSLPAHGNFYIYDEFPVCFALAADFREEMPGPGRDHRVAAIQKQRLCGSHAEWHQGFTPKEHQEMIDRQATLDRQTRLDTDRENQGHRRHLESLIVALVTALLTAGVTLLAVKIAPSPVIQVVAPAAPTQQLEPTPTGD